MEKRGVVLDDELEKTGSVGKCCPKCNKPLTQSSYCDTCGTEPFEKRPIKKKEGKLLK